MGRQKIGRCDSLTYLTHLTHDRLALPTTDCDVLVTVFRRLCVLVV